MSDSRDSSLLRQTSLLYKWAQSLVRVGEFLVFDVSDAQIGMIREEGMAAAWRILGPGRLDSLPIRRLVVYDSAMRSVASAVRLRSVFLARAEIQDSEGKAIARMQELGPFGKTRFALRDPWGHHIGRVEAVGSSRHIEFVVMNSADDAIARFRRTTDTPVLLRRDPIEYRLDFLGKSTDLETTVAIVSVPIAHAKVMRY